MVEVNEANFDQEVLKSDIPVVVDFWAVWCQPCKMMMPVVEKVATEYEGKVKFVKVNVDENMAVGSRYQVRGLPTFAVFVDGDMVDMAAGAKTPRAFKTFVDSHL